jgi:hypothetical protein
MGAAPAPRSSNATPPRPPRRALAQARDTVQTLVAQGQPEEAVEFLLAALAAVLDKSAELERLIAKLRRANHRSERTDPGQLALLLEQLATLRTADDAAPVDPEAEAREDEALDQEIAAAERGGRAAGPDARAPARGARLSDLWARAPADGRRCDARAGICPRPFRGPRASPDEIRLRDVQGRHRAGGRAGEGTPAVRGGRLAPRAHRREQVCRSLSTASLTPRLCAERRDDPRIDPRRLGE